MNIPLDPSPKPLFERPGGLRLTDRALRFCDFAQGARIADIGCGFGKSAEYMRSAYHFDISGVDSCEEAITEAKELYGDSLFLCADAASLPFGDSEFDGLLFECSFSKMDEPEAVLSEAFRVLKDGGYLIISDFCTKYGEEVRLSGVLGRMERLETITGRIKDCGFSLCSAEDCSFELRQLWGQMILDHGSELLFERTGVGKGEFGRYGYCQVISQKTQKTRKEQKNDLTG